MVSLRRVILPRYGRWALLIGVPLLLNAAVWSLLVAPQQAKLQALHEMRMLSTLKPKLEELLGESRQALSPWERSRFTADDPSAVMQTLERLAGAHRLQVKAITAEGQRGAKASPQAPAAGRGAMPLELEVTGPFGKLARWISAVESQGGLRIDSWTVSYDASNQTQRLAVKLTAFLQEA